MYPGSEAFIMGKSGEKELSFLCQFSMQRTPESGYNESGCDKAQAYGCRQMFTYIHTSCLFTYPFRWENHLISQGAVL